MNLKDLPPPPRPDILPALLKIADAQAAVARAASAWNRGQLVDAIRSARDFLDQADRALETKPPWC